MKSGKINATLPKGTQPEDMTMEVAVPLLAARALVAPKGKKAPARKAAPKAAAKKPATKAAAKKPAAKKATTAKKPAAKKTTAA